METISQIITNNINIISIDYPFDELKKDQEIGRASCRERV